MFGSNANGVVDQIIGGWQLSPVLNYSSGLPFTLSYGECSIAYRVQLHAASTGMPKHSAPTLPASPAMASASLMPRHWARCLPRPASARSEYRKDQRLRASFLQYGPCGENRSVRSLRFSSAWMHSTSSITSTSGVPAAHIRRSNQRRKPAKMVQPIHGSCSSRYAYSSDDAVEVKSKGDLHSLFSFIYTQIKVSMNRLGIAVVVVIALSVYEAGLSAQSGNSPSATSASDQQSLLQLRQMIDRGQTREALKQLDALAAQHPVCSVDRVRGVALYDQNRFAEADAAFASALKQDAHDEEATQMRGLTLYRLGRPTDAIPLLRTTGHLNEDRSKFTFWHSVTSTQDVTTMHAERSPRSMASRQIQHRHIAARMLLRREYLPVAQDFAHKALELDPQLPLAHALLGEIALAGEHLPEAIAEFERERASNPLEGSIYDRLGDAYIRAGDYTKAQRALQQALLLEPNSTGP